MNNLRSLFYLAILVGILWTVVNLLFFPPFPVHESFTSSNGYSTTTTTTTTNYGTTYYVPVFLVGFCFVSLLLINVVMRKKLAASAWLVLIGILAIGIILSVLNMQLATLASNRAKLELKQRQLEMAIETFKNDRGRNPLNWEEVASGSFYNQQEIDFLTVDPVTGGKIDLYVSSLLREKIEKGRFGVTPVSPLQESGHRAIGGRHLTKEEAAERSWLENFEWANSDPTNKARRDEIVQKIMADREQERLNKEKFGSKPIPAFSVTSKRTHVVMDELVMLFDHSEAGLSLLISNNFGEDERIITIKIDETNTVETLAEEVCRAIPGASWKITGQNTLVFKHPYDRYSN